MELWWAYILLGVAAGIFGSMLGVGGGIIMVPILVMFMNFPQKTAQGMSLAAMVLLALSGALRYAANPEIKMELGVVGLMGLAAIIGAVIGAEVARHIPVRLLQKIFAVVMVVAAVKLALFTKSPDQRGPSAAPAPDTSVAEPEASS